MKHEMKQRLQIGRAGVPRQLQSDGIYLHLSGILSNASTRIKVIDCISAPERVDQFNQSESHISIEF